MLIENDLFFYKTFKKRSFDDKRTRNSHKLLSEVFHGKSELTFFVFATHAIFLGDDKITKGEGGKGKEPLPYPSVPGGNA